MEGTDTSGNKIQRLAPSKVVVSKSTLTVNMDVDAEGVLTINPGDDLVVTLSVTNVGDSANTFDFSVLDTLDFYQFHTPLR